MLNHYKLILFISITMLSTAPIFVRMATMHPLAVGVWRMTFTSIILACILFFKKESARPLRIQNFGIFLPAGFFLFLHFYTWFISINALPIALAVIIYATNPLYTAIGNKIFFNEKYDFKYFISFLVAFSGVYISYKGSLRSFEVPFYGIINIFLSAIFYSTYLLISKKARTSWHNTEYNFYLNISTLGFFIGASFFYYLFDSGFKYQMDLTNFYATMGMALFPSLLGHTLFINCLSYFPINAISSLKLITPIISSLFAWVLLNEKANKDIISGMIITVVGLGLIYIGPNLHKMVRRFFR